MSTARTTPITSRRAIRCALLAALVMVSGFVRPALAQSADERPPFWLGLWCGANANFAVVAFGFDPLKVLDLVRREVPEARALVPARARVVPPPPRAGCPVATVGEVRVTTQGIFTRWGADGCTPFTYSTAWIGDRRVIFWPFSPCTAYGLVVTPSMVFECEGETRWSLRSPVEPVPPTSEPQCNPPGDPRLIGRRDVSMFPGDGAKRSRPGLALRYAARPGLCAPFIPAEPAGGGRPYDLAYDVFDRLEFVHGVFSARHAAAQESPPGLEGTPAMTQGIAWEWLAPSDLISGVAVSAFDFRNTGVADAVIWVRNMAYDVTQIDVHREYFIVLPGRGADLAAVAPRVAEGRAGKGASLGWDEPGAGKLARVMREEFSAIIVRSGDATDGRAPDLFKAIRPAGKTYTVAFGRSEITNGNHLYAALSRVEHDGRLTPVCLYDRMLAPPWAAW